MPNFYQIIRILIKKIKKNKHASLQKFHELLNKNMSNVKDLI